MLRRSISGLLFISFLCVLLQTACSSRETNNSQTAGNYGSASAYTAAMAVSANDVMTVGNYVLVSKKQVSRTSFDYTYRASITNNGTKSAQNVTATLTSLVSTTLVISGTLNFGDVAAGATVASTNTFTVRINRTVAFNQNNLRWNIVAELGTVSLTPGIETMVSSQHIGPEGGVIEPVQNGSPIDGVKVEFPQGALQQDAIVSLGYDTGSVIPNSGISSGKTLVLNVSATNKFDQPALITVPFENDDNVIPIPYYADVQGKLHLAHLVSVDRQAGTFTIATFHASKFSTLYEVIDSAKEAVKYLFPKAPPASADSGFVTGEDGFQIINYGSDYLTDGECLGMTAFSQWYFNKRSTWGDFYPRFMDVIGTDVSGRDITVQDVIATRAMNAIKQSGDCSKYRDEQLKLKPSETYTIIRNAIANTGPVLLGIWNADMSSGHSILAYKYSANGDIAVYDPNHPYNAKLPNDDIRKVHYESAVQRFDNYIDGSNHYTRIIADGDPIGCYNVEEPFVNILVAANSNFGGSYLPKVTITSHARIQEVYSPNPVISGTINSTEVLVTKIYAHIASTSTKFPAVVRNDGRFQIPFSFLYVGENKIYFTADGLDVNTNKAIENMQVNSDIECIDGKASVFIYLKYVPTAPAVPNTVTATYQAGNAWNYITWSPVAGATSYRVYWGTEPYVTKTSELLTSTTSTVYGHTGVLPGWTYYYRVAAVNAAGESELSAQVSAYVPFSSLSDPVNELVRTLVPIPAGTFQMGSTAFSDSKPVHTVTLAGFDMGRYEVTQAQYQAVMGTNPSYYQGAGRENCPVDHVNWYEAREFCTRLSAMTGRTFTLPSEAQWEYACRAGTTTLFSFGNSEASLDDYAWSYSNVYVSGIYGARTVGTKLPNAWGLYDIHGNMLEWCLDSWHENYTGAPTDGSAWDPDTGSYRLTRGGCWGSYASQCRSAQRSRHFSNLRLTDIGFRVLAVR